MIMKRQMITLLVVLLCYTNKLVSATEQCGTYQFSHPLYPGESCKEIYDWNPQTHSRSGYYWLINPARHVYCDMEQRVVCGSIGGWTRIASVNITRGDECPTGWNKRSQDGISFCRSPSDNDGCYPTMFSSKGINYQKVCGMARGYQKGTTDGLENDAVFILTSSNQPQYIWAYEAEFIDDSRCNCYSTLHPLVGSSYYCESGLNSGSYNHDTLYLSDPLWDGLDCHNGNSCCDNPNLPWFYKELDTATMDDVAVRICTDETYANEAILVDQLILYIQ